MVRNITFKIVTQAQTEALEELNRQLEEVRRNLNNLTKGQKKTIDKALGLDQTEKQAEDALAALRRFTGQVDDLANSATKTGNKLEAVGDDVEELGQKMKRSSKAAEMTEEAYEKLSGTTTNFRKDMDGLGTVLRKSDSALGEVSDTLTKHLSGSLKHGARDVGTMLTELRLLRSEAGKVDKAVEGMKVLPDDLAKANKKLAEATQDVADAQSKLYKVRNDPNRTVDQIEEATRALEKSNATYDEAARDLDKLNSKFEAFGSTINQAERRITKIKNAIARNKLEEFIPASAMKQMDTVEDALVSAGRAIGKFGGTATEGLRKAQRELGGLAGNRSQLRSLADELDNVRREMIATGKVDLNNLKTIMGNTTSIARSSLKDFQNQSKAVIGLNADIVRLTNSTTKFEQAQRESARAVAAGTHDLREQQRLNQLYGSALAEARTTDRSLRNRDTELVKTKQQLIDKQEELNERLEAGRRILARSGEQGSASYKAAETDVQNLTMALAQNNRALLQNEQNIKENAAAIEASGREMQKMETYQRGFLMMFDQLRAAETDRQNQIKQTAQITEQAVKEQMRLSKIAADAQEAAVRESAQQAERAAREQLQEAQERHKAEQKFLADLEKDIENAANEEIRQARRVSAEVQKEREKAARAAEQSARDSMRLAERQATQQVREAQRVATQQRMAADRTAREQMQQIRQMSSVGRLAYAAGPGGGGPPIPPGAINVFREMAAVIQQVTRLAMQMANAFANMLTSAIRAAANAARGFINSAGNMFAGLQRSLQSISNQFRDFGHTVARSMDVARASMMEFYAAGYSLLTVGSQIQQFGNMMFRGMGQSLGGFMDYERARTQAGIAGAQPTDANGNIIPYGDTITPVESYTINSDIIDDIIFDLQRGTATPDWLGGGQGSPLPVQFDAKELANGLYYYSSAIGAPITTQNQKQVSDAVATIMQMAQITDTGIETATKGVLNVMMEFGYNPRDIGSSNQLTREQAAFDTAKIAAQMGYLANISSMEVSDIVETFKMVGPQAHLLSPGALGEDPAGAGLNETFMLAFLASEVGLRGGNVGRGINQAFTSLLDPTDKMVEIAEKYWPEITTKEQFNDFFKEDGHLKGGITGFLRTLSENVDRTDLTTMLAELFTSNATRSLTGPIVMSDDFDMDAWLDDIEENPLKWMESAVAESANTVSGWFTFMKNAWFQFQASIIGSISGPLMGAFRLIGEVLFEVAQRINDIPAIGRAIAAVVTAVAALASVLGTIMLIAGGILLVGRSFAMLGGMVLPVIRVIMMGAATFLALLPIIGLVAIAIGLLAAAFKANAFGMADGWEKVKYAFENFDDVIMPVIDNFFTGLGRLGIAFNEFINGILLGDGPINNLAKSMTRFFGPLLGGTFMGALTKLRDSLAGTREAISDFISPRTFNADVLKNAGLSVQGFFEQLFLGQQRMETVTAQNALGEWLGIDNLSTILDKAAGDFSRFVMLAIGYGRAIGSVWMDLMGQIRANLIRALTGGNIENVFTNIMTLVEGIATGLVVAITTILGSINIVAREFADFSQSLNEAGDAGREFMGFTVTLDGALKALGATIGIYLGTRMALMFTPLGAILSRIIPLVFSLGSVLVGVGGRFVVFAGQVAISLASATAQLVVFTARMAALATIQTFGALFGISMQAISGATAGASAGVVRLAGAIGALNLAMFGVVGVGFVVAAGLYAIIAATQGFDVANAAARAFFEGFVNGVEIVATVAVGIVTGIAEIVGALMKLAGLGSTLDSVTQAAYALGMALGLLATRAVVGSIVTLIAQFVGLRGAIDNVAKIGVMRMAGFGIAILLIATYFDPIITAIDAVISKLNELEIAGVGAGDTLMTALAIGTTSGRGRGIAKTVLTGAGRLATRHPIIGAAAVGGAWLWGEHQDDVAYASDPQNPENGFYKEEVMTPYQGFVNTGAGISNEQALADWNALRGTQYSYSDVENDAGFRRYRQTLREDAAAEYITDLQEAYYQKHGTLPNYRLLSNNTTMEDRLQGTYIASPEIYNAAQRSATERSGAVRGVPTAKEAEKQGKEAGEAEGEGWSAGLVQSLKSAGIYDEVKGIATMMGFDIDNMGFTDVQKSIEEAMKMPELADEWANMDYSWMGPQAESYKKAMDDWQYYQKILKAVGGDVELAQKQFEAATGRMAPSQAPNWEDYMNTEDLMSEAERLAQAAAKIGLSVDDINAAFGSLRGMSTEDFLNAQSPTGVSMGGVLAGSYGDTILGNIPEGTAPWMNKTELLYDAAGTGTDLASPVGGQNMHTALTPYLEIVAAQTGVSVDELLVDIPKFHAPEEFVGVASADIALGISEGLTQGEYLALDLLGADAGVKGYEAGMNWAELTDYAVGMAVEGHDWNLADFLAASWDISIAEANQYLQDHNIDPNSISSGMMEATEIAAMTGNGAFDVMTEEMYNYLADATNDFTSNVITMTEEEWAAIPPAYKAVMKSLGITTIIDDMIPPAAKAAAEREIKEFAEIVQGLPTYLAEGMPDANYVMEGPIESFKNMGRVIDEVTGEVKYVLQDLDGTQVHIPAADYYAYQASLLLLEGMTQDAIDALLNARKIMDEAMTAPKVDIDLGGGRTMKADRRTYDYQTSLDYLQQGGHAQAGDSSGDTGNYNQMLGLPEHVKVEVELVVNEQDSRDAVRNALGGGIGQTGNPKVDIDVEIDTDAYVDSMTRLITSLGSIAETSEFKIKVIPDVRNFGTVMGGVLTAYSAPEFKIKVVPDVENFGTIMGGVLTAYGAPEFKIKIIPDVTNFGTIMQGMMTSYTGVEFKLKIVPEFAGFDLAVAQAVGANLSQTYKLKIEPDVTGFGTIMGGIIEAYQSHVIKIKLELESPSLDALNMLPGAAGGKTPSPKITITVDTGGAETAISGLNTQLTTISRAWMPVISIISGNSTTIISGLQSQLTTLTRSYSPVISVLSGNSSAIISGIQGQLDDLVGSYTATVSITVSGLGELASAFDLLANFPGSVSRTVSVTNITNNVVNNTSSRGLTAAMGGRVGSAGMKARSDSMGHITQIAARATGGTVQPGEYTLVGELGPELVQLPTGSFVHTARESARMFKNQLESQRSLTAMRGPHGRGNLPLMRQIGSSTPEYHPSYAPPSFGRQEPIAVPSTRGETKNEFHFHGDIVIGDKKAGDEFFAEIDRRAGRRTSLAQRGMLPTDDTRPW